MVMNVQAAVVREFGAPWVIENLQLGDLQADEVLVRMVATGICHSDIAYRNPLFSPPCVLGHEGAGIVEKVGGAVTHVRTGQKVILSFDSCGTCSQCTCHLPSYCREFTQHNFIGRLDGSSSLSRTGASIRSHFFGQSSFATHAVVAGRSAIPVSDDIPLEWVGSMGCGFLTGAGAVFRSMKVRRGSKIAVFGTGAVGMAAIAAAKVLDCSQIVAIDIAPSRLEVAREFGATDVLDGHDPELARKLVSITGAGADYTFDTTGVPSVMGVAIDCLAILGTFGHCAARDNASFSPLSMMRGNTIRGVVEGDSDPQLHVPELLGLWKQGRFPVDRLVRHYPFAKINEAVEDAVRGDVIKPVLLFD